MLNDSSSIQVPDIPIPISPEPSNSEKRPKTSSEILSELFGAFNVKPPTIIDDVPIIPKNEANIGSDEEVKNKKHKKHKKHKKGKKRKRSSSQSSGINKKKKKKDAKKRKKHRKDDASSSESNSSKHKKRKRKNKGDSESDKSSDNDAGNIHSHKHKKIKLECDIGVKIDDKNSLDMSNKHAELISMKESGTNDTRGEENVSVNKILKSFDKEKDMKQEISKTIDKVFNSVPLIVYPEIKIESNMESDNVPLPMKKDTVDEDKDSIKTGSITFPEKPKLFGGKIKIQNLKFSSVFEETVRQVEEKAKQKAERYEEGELSDSSSEPQRSPSPLSSVSPVNSEPINVEKPEKKKCKHHHKSREQHRSRSRKRHRSYSDSTRSSRRNHSKHSRDGSEKHSERSKHKEKCKDRSHKYKSRSHERSRHRSRDREQKHSSSRSHRTHSKSKEPIRSGSEERIDKRKLLEIARRNALTMLKAPALGSEMAKVTITAGGKTVDELTDFCKLLSKKDADGHESISSDSSHSSDSESQKPFHHPFQIKDRPSNIIMNIRNEM